MTDLSPHVVMRLWNASHILIGHGLSKDLHAIGLAQELLSRPEGGFDTMTFPKFQVLKLYPY